MSDPTDQDEGVTFFQPATNEAAKALLAASPSPFDSPTQHRYRSTAHLDDTFSQGRRRPEWVWAVRRTDGSVGSVAVLGNNAGTPLVLDHFGLTGDAPTDQALLCHASDAARALGVTEAGVFAPPAATLDSPTVKPLGDALRAAGWDLLVERLHYEFEPSPDLADGPNDLDLVPLGDPDDPRLRSLLTDVMVGSLDAHDLLAIQQGGIAAAVDEVIGDLLEDPVECIRLAYDPSRPDLPPKTPVGLVSWRAFPETGRGFVFFVGVGSGHRGHGYSARMLAAATGDLIASGATTLIADADLGNAPMAASFAKIGWPVTETRIDLAPRD